MKAIFSKKNVRVNKNALIQKALSFFAWQQLATPPGASRSALIIHCIVDGPPHTRTLNFPLRGLYDAEISGVLENQAKEVDD
jgi:hypothetical protein